MLLIKERILKASIKKYDFKVKKEHKTIFKKWIESFKKEAEISSDFLNDIFGNILSYEIDNSKGKFNLLKEVNTEKDGTCVDGVLGYFEKEQQDNRVIIKLKGKKTSNFAGLESQAFEYSSKINGIEWIILSNTKEIRLYLAGSGGKLKYQSFKLKELAENKNEAIKTFCFLLGKEQLFTKVKQQSLTYELVLKSNNEVEAIKKEFYEQYKAIREKLWEHIKAKNSNITKEILLFRVQKLLDRVLFICFSQSYEFIQKDTLKEVMELGVKYESEWKNLKSLFERFNEKDSIAYLNGGLFKEDKILNDLVIENEIINEIVSLFSRDFKSDLPINVLGHIFEQSLSYIEAEKAKLQAENQQEKASKRKRDGIFYTPENITQHIVKQSVGSWLKEREKASNFYDLSNIEKQTLENIKHFCWKISKRKLTEEEKRIKEAIEVNIKKWKEYFQTLNQIKVLDPSCGSGAFLVQVLDFLQQERIRVGENIDKLCEIVNAPIFYEGMNNTSKDIVKNNIYGVDINHQSIQITKLSLWVATSRKQETLVNLDNNIKVGNSLIDNKEVAGIYVNEEEKEKSLAFKWKEEFSEVFRNGGFDVIVGNPPYFFYDAKIDFHKKQINFFKHSGQFFHIQGGRLQAFKIFIEQSTKLNKEGGYLSFIFQNSFLADKYCERIRNYIMKDYTIFQLDSFPERDNKKTRVFEDAKMSTCILTAKKASKEDYRFELNIYETKYMNIYTSAIFRKKELKHLGIPHNGIPLLKHEEEKDLLLKLKEKDTISLQAHKGEINENIHKHLMNTNSSNPSIIKGAGIQRYFVTEEMSQGILEYLNEEKYHQENKGERAKGHKVNRIGLQGITGVDDPIRIIGTMIDEGNYLLNGCVYIEASEGFDDRYILGIINSKLINWLFKRISTNSSINIYQINNLPILKVSLKEQESLVSLVQEILDLTKSFKDFKRRFSKFVKIKANHFNKRLSQKLQMYYNLSSNEFLKELKKLFKDFSLKEEEKWVKYFEEEKRKAKEVKESIEEIDKKIDEKVYEMYKLTRKEIDIVEEKRDFKIYSKSKENGSPSWIRTSDQVVNSHLLYR